MINLLRIVHFRHVYSTDFVPICVGILFQLNCISKLIIYTVRLSDFRDTLKGEFLMSFIRIKCRNFVYFAGIFGMKIKPKIYDSSTATSINLVMVKTIYRNY
jgi:hypothetical protein